MPKIIFLIMFIASFGCFCCKDKIVEPPITNFRELNWTLDTLVYPGSFQTLMGDIWGSAPNNVYVVGHNDQGAGQMFHFNGKNWADVKLHIIQRGTISGAIYGFTSDDIWAVGNRFEKNPAPPRLYYDWFNYLF